MVIVGKNASLALYVTNAAVATAPGALVSWLGTGAATRLADLSPGGQTVFVTRPGTYKVTAKFAVPPASTVMDFAIALNGVNYGNTAYAGETLVAVMYLAPGDVVGVRNISASSVTPAATPNSSWLMVEGA